MVFIVVCTSVFQLWVMTPSNGWLDCHSFREVSNLDFRGLGLQPVIAP